MSTTHRLMTIVVMFVSVSLSSQFAPSTVLGGATLQRRARLGAVPVISNWKVTKSTTIEGVIR